MICSSLNREGRIVRLLDRRTLLKSGGGSGSQVSRKAVPPLHFTPISVVRGLATGQAAERSGVVREAWQSALGQKQLQIIDDAISLR